MCAVVNDFILILAINIAMIKTSSIAHLEIPSRKLRVLSVGAKLFGNMPYKSKSKYLIEGSKNPKINMAKNNNHSPLLKSVREIDINDNVSLKM